MSHRIPLYLFRSLLCFAVLLAVSGIALAQDQDVLAAAAFGLADQATVEQLATGSELVLIGSCTEVRSVWSDPRTLVTLATIQVGEVLKGAAGASITVVLPGGVDANRAIPIAMTYPGAPSITTGENVFLFLLSDDTVENGYGVAGFSQGKFSILRNEADEEFVARDLTATRIQTDAGIVRGRREVTPLNEFKKKVRGSAQ